MTAFVRLGLVLVALWLSASPSQAERRLALIVANDDYLYSARLLNPIRDARLIEKSLREVGFEVTLALNQTRAGVLSELDTFLRTVAGEEDAVAMFFYGGHAAQIDQQSYLLATDAKVESLAELKESGLSLNTILLEMERANKRGLTFLVADGCRDNPFVERLPEISSRATEPVKSGFQGFGALAPGRGAALFLSTQPNEVSYDGDGEHSPFGLAYARHVPTPDIDWSEFARRVQTDVIKSTEGKQKPDFISNLGKDFFFAKPSTAAAEKPIDVDTRAALAAVADEKTGKLKATYDESHALVIGVSTYQDNSAWRNLPGVKDDVAAVAAVLRDVHKFKTVTLISDPDSNALQTAFKEFVSIYGAINNARLLIYFAGHGFTTKNAGRSIGWLVPADAPSYAVAPQRFGVTAVSLRRVQEYSETIVAKHVLWVFDSCFSGQAIGMLGMQRMQDLSPFERDRLSKPVRRVITSGSEDEEVPDRSIFAKLFVDALAGRVRVGDREDVITGSALGDFLKQHVYDAVAKRYSRKQTPQSELIVFPALEAGDIIFRLEPELTKVAKQ